MNFFELQEEIYSIVENSLIEEDIEVNEDLLMELSKKTLGSYVKKAGKSRLDLQKNRARLDKADGDLASAGFGLDNDSRSSVQKARDNVRKKIGKIDDKDFNRQDGIHRAIKRLTK
jgi:hypothetical protein